MKHEIVTTNKLTVTQEAIDSVIAYMNKTKDRANMHKANGNREMQDWETMNYIGMKYVMEKLGLIYSDDIEFD